MEGSALQMPQKGLFSDRNDFQELARIKADLGLSDDDNLWRPTDEEISPLRSKLNDGRLARVIQQYRSNMSSKVKPDGRQPWRTSIHLLGACAMGLGCDLTADFVGYMKASHYSVTSFDKCAKKQFSDAFKFYQRGIPYHYDSIDSKPLKRESLGPRIDNQSATETNEGNSRAGHIDTLSPATEFDEGKEGESEGEGEGEGDTIDVVPEPTKVESAARETRANTPARSYQLRPSLEPKLAPNPSKSTNDGCSNCGSIGHSDGMPLLACGGCRNAIYCGETCQRKQWSAHQASCDGASPRRNGRKGSVPAQGPAKKRKRTG